MLHKNNARPALAAALLTCILLATVRPSYAAGVPLEVYGRLPSLEQVALSPSGTRLAMIRTLQNQRVLAIVSLADRKMVGKSLGLGQLKLRSIEWADDDHLMIVMSTTTTPFGLLGPAREWSMLNVLDINTGKLHNYPDPDQSETRIMNVISDDTMVRNVGGHTVLFIPGAYVGDEVYRGLFRVDLSTGRQKLIREGNSDTQSWLVDENGEVAAQEDYSSKEQRWKLLERRDGRLREVASGHEPIDIPELLGFGPVAGTLLMQTVEDGDPVWRQLSLKDGSFGPAMAERDSLESPIEDQLTHRMIGGVHVGDTARYTFFDSAVQSWWNSIVTGYDGEQVELISASADLSKIIVEVNGPLHGYEYDLMDIKTHRAQRVGEVYDGLGSPLEVKRIDYAAADGLNIPAYLTFPRGKPPKSLPLIVFPHGGPRARDTAQFNWWAQAMASQGYLVLQPNFRGSSLTMSHTSAGFGEWGRKMQTDLSDGVRYLVKQGMVDPQRVCIVGGSYGGYAALAGVTLDPGVYRCAVSVAGISDLKHMLQESESDTSERRFWNRYMGVTGPSDPLLQQISPIKHIDAINVPVLLIHGKDDTVVAFDQSRDMYDAMKHAKKDVEMVTLKNEDHWLSRSETRLQMLQASVAFLRAHNPPD